MPVTATGARATPVQSHHPELTKGPAPAAKAGAASAAASLEAPNRTPASAPYSEPPVLMSRADTSVGVAAAKTMASTWDAKAAEGARSTGAEGGKGFEGPMPARTLRPFEESLVKKAEEKLKSLDDNPCETIVVGLVNMGASRVSGKGGKVASAAASLAAAALCRAPERGLQDGGGERGGASASPAGGVAGATGYGRPDEGGAGGASGAVR